MNCCFKEEMNAAVAHYPSETMWQLSKKRLTNIRMFHEKQLRNSWITTDETGTMLGQKVTPLDAVGVYVPGGTAAYPSSVLMNVMPAKAAGCQTNCHGFTTWKRREIISWLC